MSKSIDDLLAELEGEEKTAEDVFAANLVSEEADEAENKTDSEKTAEDVSEEETAEEKTAENAEQAEESEEITAEKSVSEDSEEKVAEQEAEEAEESPEETVEEKTASTEKRSEEELVKIAEDMGKVMARSCYAELVAMGIMPPTNDDVELPPISQVSMPSQSPVTVAADAKQQLGGEKGEKQEKKASAGKVTKELLTNMYNNLYNEE